MLHTKFSFSIAFSIMVHITDAFSLHEILQVVSLIFGQICSAILPTRPHEVLLHLSNIHFYNKLCRNSKYLRFVTLGYLILKESSINQ
jgi:hypothetical protein